MSESEDKAKKLKEIQERLAEIQGGSAKSANKPTPSPSSKPTASNTLKPTEPKASSTSTAKQTVPKTTATKKEVAEKKVTPTKAKSQEEINWKENRRKDSQTAKAKKSSTSKLSKIYTLISLIITLAVCSYFVYTFFLSSDDETELISKVPEDLVIEESTEEEPMAENTEQAIETEDEIESAEVVQQEVVSDNRKIESSTAKAEEVKSEPKSTPVTSAVTSKVPNGIIISYASNSTEDMAEKNAKLLASKGFKASYYYMPDKNSSSPQLYKVYVGPYDSESAAMPDFKKIVKLNDKAFILRAN